MSSHFLKTGYACLLAVLILFSGFLLSKLFHTSYAWTFLCFSDTTENFKAASIGANMVLTQVRGVITYFGPFARTLSSTSDNFCSNMFTTCDSIRLSSDEFSKIVTADGVLIHRLKVATMLILKFEKHFLCCSLANSFVSFHVFFKDGVIAVYFSLLPASVTTCCALFELLTFSWRSAAANQTQCV